MIVTDEDRDLRACLTLTGNNGPLPETGGSAHLFRQSGSRENAAVSSSGALDETACNHVTTYVPIDDAQTLSLSLTLSDRSAYFVQWRLEGQPVSNQYRELDVRSKTSKRMLNRSVDFALDEIVCEDYWGRLRRNRMAGLSIENTGMKFVSGAEDAKAYVSDAERAAGSVRADVYVYGMGDEEEKPKLRKKTVDEFHNVVSAAAVTSGMASSKVLLVDEGEGQEREDEADAEDVEGASHWMTMEFRLCSAGWLAKNHPDKSMEVHEEWRKDEPRKIRPSNDRIELRYRGAAEMAYCVAPGLRAEAAEANGEKGSASTRKHYPRSTLRGVKREAESDDEAVQQLKKRFKECLDERRARAEEKESCNDDTKIEQDNGCEEALNTPKRKSKRTVPRSRRRRNRAGSRRVNEFLERLLKGDEGWGEVDGKDV